MTKEERIRLWESYNSKVNKLEREYCGNNCRFAVTAENFITDFQRPKRYDTIRCWG